MPKNRWIPALAALWLWACGAGVSGAASARYTVKSFEADDGLPQSSVFAVTQTRDGYLWLGTGDGLARFDGIRCTPFNENNTPGLAARRFVKLFEDSRTNLWIGSDSAGVFLVTEGEVTNVNIGRGPAGHLVAACEDPSGAVWLSTADGGLHRYRHGKVETVNASNCHALIADDSGLVWIGVREYRPRGGSFDTLFALGPISADTGNALVQAYQIPVGQLDLLLPSRGGGYWRLANGHIQKWHRDHMEKDLGSYPCDPRVISAACEDFQGNLILGTYGNGVYWFDAQGKATHLSGDPAELGTSFIFSLAMDAEGCLWVGTDGEGLKRVRPQAFEVLEASRGKSIKSACEDAQGGLWFAINNGGLDCWRNGELKEYRAKEGLADPYVQAVFVDREQRTWAGTENEGLFQLKGGSFERAAGFPSGESTRHVSAIFEDSKGALWVGTHGGLACLDHDRWRLYTSHDGLSANAIQAIADDAEGGIWLGTESGLDHWRDEKAACFYRANGLPSDSVCALVMDSDGVLWAGTSAGLARLQTGKWNTYAGSDGLPGGAVGYLVEDTQGSLWIGSTAGLTRVPKKELNQLGNGQTNAVSFRVYGVQDGLPTAECASGSQPAAFRAATGKLWFPTIKGLVSLDPGQLLRNSNPPPVIIESVLIEGQPLNTNTLRTEPLRSIVVPPGKQRVEIRYTSLNLAAADRARFRYRLEGNRETAWSSPASTRAVDYPWLPQGHYHFHVQACNEDDVWNDKGSLLEITVLPPFWRTAWFLVVSALCSLGLIVGSVHYVSTQRLQRQVASLRQQEALEHERARIARDLHDQLGANLTQIALLGEMAESDKNTPAEVEDHARQISQTARDTTHALDEIVWTVNPSNDTLDGLVNYICKYAQDYLALAGLRYRLEVPPQLPDAPISPELRHNVFLVAKEAVNNVVKHAQASVAWLRLRLEPGRFTLEIEDNGKGLSAADEKKGRNGLRNMRKRMTDVGGELELGPGAEGGTRVRLTARLENLK